VTDLNGADANTDCSELWDSAGDEQPDHTIFFTCRPAWECFQGQGSNFLRRWESVFARKVDRLS
jgi:hypothetical protein